MNIALTGTKITQDTKFLAFEKNNNVDVINVIVDTDESWTYKLDVRYPDKCCTAEPLYNIINLTRTGNLCTAILTSDMLPFAGKYTMQLRGINGDKVSHSDVFDTWVKYSIEPGSTYNPVPSEFYQIEDNITKIEANVTEMNNNPPYPSDDGYWMIWDVNKHEYTKSDISIKILPTIDDTTKGKYLTNNGTDAEWDDVEALPDMSSDTAGKMLTNDGAKAEWGGAVRYDIYQNLNAEYAYQARENIGAFPHRELEYFYVDAEGAKHDNDICAAWQYSVIYPGNTYSDGDKSNNGMAFPAFVTYKDFVAVGTYKVGLLDAEGIAWEVITSQSNIYAIERVTNYGLYVNITETEDSDGNITYHADHTYDEIIDAYNAGKSVYAIVKKNSIVFVFSLYMLSQNRGIIRFKYQDIFNNDSTYLETGGIERLVIDIIIDQNNNVRLIGGEGDSYAIPQQFGIGITKNADGVISASKSIQEIGEIFNTFLRASNGEGMPNIIAVYNTEMYRFTNFSSRKITFSYEGEITKILTGTTGDDNKDTWAYEEIPTPFPCILTQNSDGSYSCDKTYSEIMSAIKVGRIPYVKFNDGITYGYRNIVCWYSQWNNIPSSGNDIVFYSVQYGIEYNITIDINNDVDLITRSRTMTGATADKDGTSGLVPHPQAGDNNKFLRGDGTWADAESTDLPTVTADDNGKFLRVVNGAWAAAEIASAGGVSF